MLRYIRRSSKLLPERELNDIKQICKVLFIDDQDFKVVDILKTTGWMNTKLLKDVESLDCVDIADAHVIFVDIIGVGLRLGFRDEGLGLIKALKEKYPSKALIVYSAESKGNRFHEGLSKADARLHKDADPYEFQVLVEKYSRIAFSLDEVLNRIKATISEQTGIQIEIQDVQKKLLRIRRKGIIEETNVRKAFNIQNAANLVSILNTYFSIGSNN